MHSNFQKNKHTSLRRKNSLIFFLQRCYTTLRGFLTLESPSLNMHHINSVSVKWCSTFTEEYAKWWGLQNNAHDRDHLYKIKIQKRTNIEIFIYTVCISTYAYMFVLANTESLYRYTPLMRNAIQIQNLWGTSSAAGHCLATWDYARVQERDSTANNLELYFWTEDVFKWN